MIRLLLLCLLFGFPLLTQDQALAPTHPFTVFDSTGFSSKPDLTQYCLKRIAVVYPAFMWDASDAATMAGLPDKHRIGAFAQLANESTNTLVIDIEQWPLSGDPAAVNASVEKLESVIGWFKQPIASLQVGFYGYPPLRDYWDSIQGMGSPRYLAWQRENDALAPLAARADALFPSLYTFYEDRGGWSKYAVEQIKEARRLAGGKPVYVFLWPQYHSTKALANVFLPRDYWRLELETARKYADGIVIWCCSNRQAWNDDAPWWLETQSFMKEIKSPQ